MMRFFRVYKENYYVYQRTSDAMTSTSNIDRFSGNFIDCSVEGNEQKKVPPAIICAVGFSNPSKPDIFQDYIRSTNGHTQFLLRLDIDFAAPNGQKPHLSSRPPNIVRLKIFSTQYDDERGEWKACLVADESDLRLAVRNNPDAGFDMSPEIRLRYPDMKPPSRIRAAIFISYKRFLDLVGKVWIQHCCNYEPAREREELWKLSFSCSKAEEFNGKRKRRNEDKQVGELSE
ncbi:hypothetical protein F4805DRAFT_475687 [Annulohypoxylon moriforme]|nr:hypothetical protein F4805DRAFT_475687 [Annulohypoxylon moriforme]